MANILIGYSTCQVTREAFERQGHRVWTCDLLDVPGCPWHLQMDAWEALNNYKWDAAVLHPMCTYLTVSAAWAFKDPDFDRYPGVGYHQRISASTLVGAARRRAREEALDNVRRILALPFPVAMENPATSFINKAIRPPDQVIHPWMYGDDASKATGMWLNGLPALTCDVSQFALPRLVRQPNKAGVYSRFANQTDSGQNRVSPSEDRWLERSRTYPGIAEAMGSQWGAYLSLLTP